MKIRYLLLVFAIFQVQASEPSRIFAGPQAYYSHLYIANGSATGPTATPNPFTGVLGGFILGYEYKKSLYAVLQSSYALGSLTRKNQGTGNNNRFIHEILLDSRFGYNWQIQPSWAFTPFTGAGFRWNTQYRNPGVLSGLKYNYFKIYIPLGFLLDYSPTPMVSLGIDFEWMPDVLTMVSISSLKGSYWELERMNNYLIQIPCTFRFCSHYEISLVPFWMHFDDGASTAETDAGIALNLDKQVTNDWGGRLSFKVNF